MPIAGSFNDDLPIVDGNELGTFGRSPPTPLDFTFWLDDWRHSMERSETYVAVHPTKQPRLLLDLTP